MRQVWLAERALADTAAVPPRPVTMHFVENVARDRGRNNLPTANEIAALYYIIHFGLYFEISLLNN